MEAIQFAKYDWLYEANYGLQKDMEVKKTLLPRFDPVSIDLSIVEDKARMDKFKKNHPGRELALGLSGRPHQERGRCAAFVAPERQPGPILGQSHHTSGN